MNIEVNSNTNTMEINGKPVTLNKEGKIRVGGAVPCLFQLCLVRQHHPRKEFRQAASNTAKKVLL